MVIRKPTNQPNKTTEIPRSFLFLFISFHIFLSFPAFFSVSSYLCLTPCLLDTVRGQRKILIVPAPQEVRKTYTTVGEMHFLVDSDLVVPEASCVPRVFCPPIGCSCYLWSVEPQSWEHRCQDPPFSSTQFG